VQSKNIVEVINLEKVSYKEALDLQLHYHKLCADGEMNGILILLEHLPVITLGVKPNSNENILVSSEILNKNGIELVETDRGGDTTYHGPGQLVGYPIFKLRDLDMDLTTYLRNLENVIIKVLEEYGLYGSRNGPAGVWVKDKKVCSIGVAIRKQTTYHGFALNINPNFNHFKFINPCGLEASQISSMAELLGYAPSIKHVKSVVLNKFEQVFGVIFNKEEANR
jgi:lipoyl(octanoyl) transferase